MKKTTNSNSEKMVVVNGKLVPEAKRLEALAFGQKIAAAKDASLKATRDDEARELREAGWKEDEINLHFNAQDAAIAKSHGFIHPSPRTYRAPKVPFGDGIMFH